MRRFKGASKVTIRVLAVSSVAAAMMAGFGCDVPSFIDPGETVTRQNTGQPLLLPILRKLETGIEEPTDDWANATDPLPSDMVSTTQDYRIGADDILNITISDIAGPNSETARQFTVTSTGMLNLPLIDPIRAEGLTESQLQQAIREAYARANIANNANVSVTVLSGRARAFSIIGAVGQPGEYLIQKKNFRLNDALVLARDASYAADYAYIIRTEEPRDEGSQPSMPGSPEATPGMEAPAVPPTTSPGPDILAPRSQAQPQANPASATAWRIDLLRPKMLQVPADPSAGAVRPSGLNPTAPDQTPAGNVPPAANPAMVPGMAPGTVQPPATPDANSPTTGPATVSPGSEGRYIIIDGKPVLVGGVAPDKAAGIPAPTDSGMMPGMAAPGATTQPFEFQDLAPQSGERIIRVPLKALRNGDTRYNIVIRPNDFISVVVPSNKSGFYYLGGHVARPGAFSIQGSEITIKQAIWAAGGLDQFAIPQRTDIVRRIGTDREVFCRVNLAAIFEGKQPDVFIKPDDLVMVGTNFFAPFIAAVRNGFRASYGFGFFYDRNFYDDPNDRNR